MGPLIGEAIARLVGWIFVEILSFPWFLFIGWLTLKVITLGLKPQGKWYEYETFGKVYWLGAVLAFTIASVLAVRLAWQ